MNFKNCIITDMKCFECGEKIIKLNKPYFEDGIWKYYFCRNHCKITCNNCNNSDNKGDCKKEFCYNKLGWEPKKNEI